MDVQIIQKYFKDLTPEQVHQLTQLQPLYEFWNAQINVISRKDIDHLYVHHVLHSLSILKFYDLVPGSEVLDLGTGGGFPGIPLAILRPAVKFTLIDGTAKKLKVVQDVAEKLQLDNVNIQHTRAEELKQKFDMVVTRAVAKSVDLIRWSRPLLKKKHLHAYPNGILALKGGDLKEEFREMGRHEYHEIHPIDQVFQETYFMDKYVVYLQG